VTVEAAEANYLGAWRLLCGNTPSGIVDEDDQILFAAAAGRIGYFNSAFIKPSADAAGCVGRAAEFFRARALPFVVRFRAGGGSDVDDACKHAGLSAAGESPLMVADVASMPPLDDSVTVRRNDASTFGDHLTMIAAGFGLPVKVLGSFFTPALIDGGRFETFTAYDASDAPVSTAALIETPGVAGIYNVATPEAHRRRGLGEATTRAAVDAGRGRGCTLATLQASEMGYPVYERMGFRTVARWRAYVGE
jgi:GNAT superfamily N-acetyltransferase